MIRKHALPLDLVTSEDERRVGGKAFNCARLKRAGFNVPDGLVLVATASAEVCSSVATHPWFAGMPEHTLFAVRSSGIGEDGNEHSFAGVHHTSLNVQRSELGPAIRCCLASARAAEAVEYRRTRGITVERNGMAVLIQRMIQPVAAGVAFSSNPVTGAPDEIVINSSFGDGDALVSGRVDPDEFVVHKNTRELVWSRLGEAPAGRQGRPSLSWQQVSQLADLMVRIEGHYGAPQDVEWCHDGEVFWVLQSRPVTALPRAASDTEWTRANLAEVLPDLTSPQALYAFEQLLNDAERKYLGRMMAPEHEFGPMVKAFCGRLYFNLTQLRQIGALGNMKTADVLRSMGHADAIHPSDETLPQVPISRRLATVPDMARILWRHLRVQHLVRAHEARVDMFRSRVAGIDPRTLSDGEIWAMLDDWLATSSDSIQLVLLLAGVLLHELPVRRLCERIGFPFERLLYPQLAAGQRSVSAQQAFDLAALVEAARQEPRVVSRLRTENVDSPTMRAELGGTTFVARFDAFLDAYGHRGRYESDWSLPRYREDPTPLLRAIRAHLEDDTPATAADLRARQERESAEAWQAFTSRLSGWQRWFSLPRIRRTVRRIKQYYLWREQVRSDMVRVLEVVRRWHLALADRFVERGWLDRREDYFLVTLPEVASVVSGQRESHTLRAVAGERREELARHRTLRMPLLMRESELARRIRTSAISTREADGRWLTGHPVSSGRIEGEVVVVHDPAEFGQMKRGAILVAQATDPSWTPLFTLASGVIVEVGGVLSHASTIAREYGLPAIANVKDATRRLRTGDRVRLDAIQGVVHKLEKGAPTG